MHHQIALITLTSIDSRSSREWQPLRQAQSVNQNVLSCSDKWHGFPLSREWQPFLEHRFPPSREWQPFRQVQCDSGRHSERSEESMVPSPAAQDDAMVHTSTSSVWHAPLDSTNNVMEHRFASQAYGTRLRGNDALFNGGQLTFTLTSGIKKSRPEERLSFENDIVYILPLRFIRSFAITSFWISFVPSKILLIRESR